MKQHYINPKRFLLSMLSILFLLSGVYAQFTPGDGGTLPAFTPFTQPEEKSGRVTLKNSHRQNGLFAGSVYAFSGSFDNWRQLLHFQSTCQ